MDETPRDTHGAIRALLNQVPQTMTATAAVLVLLDQMQPAGGVDGVPSLQELHQVVGKVAASLVICATTLENAIERLQGRPGIPEGRFNAIVSEFFGDG